jgi:hypothetical protein
LLPAGFIFIALVLGGFAWQKFTKSEVVVEWTTASELSTVGFNLYRSDLIDGIYNKVNDELIPASPDPLTGGNYTYLDDQVSPGTTYYYQLEDVESDGSTSRYGPIEVQAQRGGYIVLLISGSFLVIGIYIIYRLSQSRKITNELQPE